VSNDLFHKWIERSDTTNPKFPKTYKQRITELYFDTSIYPVNKLLGGENMAVIEKFLGQRVDIPEDRKYYAKQGLWAKPEDDDMVFGFTEPALILAGGLNDLDWLVSEKVSVTQGQDVVFVITEKILYIETPLQGIISFNPEVKQNLSLALKDPYGKGWLFRIKPDADLAESGQTATDAKGYTESLKGTDGFKNPEGLKGGISSICKAVYSGIREQKI
jgi:glycine cleavage system H protein